MKILKQARKLSLILCVLFVSLTITSCGGVQSTSQYNSPELQASYQQLERGDTPAGQEYADWVLSTAQGLLSDAYLREDSKLGVVITPDVPPNEVRDLAKSLIQGMRNQFSNRDLSVFVYAPDRELILSAQYDNASQNILYN